MSFCHSCLLVVIIKKRKKEKNKQEKTPTFLWYRIVMHRMIMEKSHKTNWFPLTFNLSINNQNVCFEVFPNFQIYFSWSNEGNEGKVLVGFFLFACCHQKIVLLWSPRLVFYLSFVIFTEKV